MAFYVNIGYRFARPATVVPDGSVILCSAMPKHQLERRALDTEAYPHMQQRVFDPQLYMASLDASQCPEHCVKLATYPWFGVTGVRPYSSAAQKQAQWMESAKSQIVGQWPGVPPSDATMIANAVKDCLEFQRRIGCQFAIAPSPLIVDPASDFTREMAWLDAATDYVSNTQAFNLPLYATLAFSDICVLYSDPLQNSFLSLIADAISAREVDGVYLVVEQGSEAADTRQCGNTRTLRSILHLVHMLARDANLNVAVNFLGAFGLTCEAAGASLWASDWYKSLYRLRLSDKLSAGRAFPSFWSHPAAVDIHLHSDLDTLGKKQLLTQVRDDTTASKEFIDAVALGVPVRDVPAWQYRQANVAASIEHYLLSCIHCESAHGPLTGTARLDEVQNWLNNAVRTASQIDVALGVSRKTKTSHVVAWDEAFRLYREDHKV